MQDYIEAYKHNVIINPYELENLYVKLHGITYILCKVESDYNAYLMRGDENYSIFNIFSHIIYNNHIYELKSLYTSFTDNLTYNSNTCEEINIIGENPMLTSIDGVLYMKETMELCYYPKNKKDTYYKIPENCKFDWIEYCYGYYYENKYLKYFIYKNKIIELFGKNAKLYRNN